MKIDHRVYHFLGGVLAIRSNRIRLVFPKKLGLLYPEISLRNPYQIQAGMMIPRSYESSIVTSVASATYLSISISYFKSQSPLFSIFWLVTLPSFLLASLVAAKISEFRAMLRGAGTILVKRAKSTRVGPYWGGRVLKRPRWRQRRVLAAWRAPLVDLLRWPWFGS